MSTYEAASFMMPSLAFKKSPLLFFKFLCQSNDTAKQMIQHNKISDTDVRNKIKKREICFGGNQKLKIYGTLKCASGKRMKRKNRVFFSSKTEASKR